jgi:predicted nucleic acid-binding protein
LALVDTSVWISHFRDGNGRLAKLLETGEVVCHPLIIGELACGDLKNRGRILSLLGALPKAPLVEHDEVLAFVEGRALWGKGLGYVDVHLLAAALLGGVPLWTLDKQLDKTAAGLHCRYESAR